MAKIDIAKKNFDEFKTNYDEFKKMDISESDTRSKILDYILIKVLNWSESNLRREGHSDAGYFDYKISIPGFNFVTEAKKNFELFKLPIKHNYVTLGTLFKENAEVIKQIRNYLVEEGSLYGVITNGHQFIVAKFINTDGSPWKSNKSVIFKSVDDIETRFIEFYNLLSFDSVVENSGFKIDEEISFEGKTIYSTVSYPDKELIRNSLSANLTPLLDSIFGEIFHNDFTNDEELVKECFVSNKEVKKNRSEIEQLFADLPPKLEEVIPAVNTENIISQIQEDFSQDNISINEPTPPKPIIIVGSKGAGKTTFINYLFTTSFSTEIRKTHPVLYLDIRKYTTKDLREESTKIFSEILEKIYDGYDSLNLHKRNILIRIYIKEIKRNDEGIWSELERKSPEYESKLSEFLADKLRDVESHFVKLSHYLIRERRIRLCVIFDNADQLDISAQQEAFLFSQSINSKAKCGVILSLREGYYYKWRNKPPFDAYYSHVYHITAPPYGDVIQKRIDYALKEVQKKGKVRGQAGLFGGTGADIEVSVQAIVDFLNSAKNTLFSTKNSAMLSFLSQTTYPNIREGLRLFKRFLISGHTQVEQYVIRQSVDPNSKIPIPIHEFVKSIALDNKLIYNSESSVVYNIFKPFAGSINHFLKYKILKYLSNFSKASTGGEKFVLVESLIDVFGHSGYRRGVLLGELSELLNNGLVESQELATDTDVRHKLSLQDSLTLTFKGYYYVEELVNRFHYLELVAQDTPVFDNEHFEKISEAFVEADERGYKKLENRIAFVKSFYEYLKFAESKETVEGESTIKGVMNNIKDNGLNKDVKIITGIIKAGNKR